MKDSFEDAIQRNASPPYQELLMLKHTNHLHQHDTFLLEPFLAFLRLGMMPDLNVSEIYLLNTQCLLKFLHKNGFHNGTWDIAVVERNIKKHEKEYVDYVYTSPSFDKGYRQDE